MSSDSILSLASFAGFPNFFPVLHVFRSISSTNLYAKHLADLGAPNGTLVVAASQQGGYGRHRRTWASPKGGLWFSAILRPTINIAEVNFLPMLAALGVGQAISDVSRVEWGFRWPNDVVVGRRKMAGILGESKVRGEDLLYVVIGVGINVNFTPDQLPPELRKAATTLLHESQKRLDLARLLVQLLFRLEANMQYAGRGRSDELLEALKKHDVLEGRAVRLLTDRGPVRGIGRGIQSDGRLLVGLGDGTLLKYRADQVERVELIESC